jgi:hypothetical protein
VRRNIKCFGAGESQVAQAQGLDLGGHRLGPGREAAELLRDHFRLTYWEYQGKEILPREEAA